MTKYTVEYRRKREGKTDYRKRMKLLAAKKPRLVIRKSLKNLLMQVIEYSSKGDIVIVSAHSRDIVKLGWKANLNSIPACYLCGYLLGKKALQKKIPECILDMGMQTSIKGNAIYAALKGAVDAGLKIPCSKEIFPDEKRIKGEHISAYGKLLKGNKEKYDKQFSACVKKAFDAENIVSHFEEIKSKIGAKK